MIVDIPQTSRSPKYTDVIATPNVIAIAPKRAGQLECRQTGGWEGEITPAYGRLSTKAIGHLDIAPPERKRHGRPSL